MKTKTKLSSIALFALLGGSAWAQSAQVTPQQIDALNQRIAELEKRLAQVDEASPSQAHLQTAKDPDAVKIGSVSIKPYGYIKVDATYDSHKPFPSTGGLTLYAQPEVNGSDSQTDFSARDSRLGLDFDLPVSHGIKATAKLETDFFSNGSETAYGLRLRHSYINLDFGDGLSVRAGQDWDAFFYVAPITVDAGFLGNAGHLYSRRPQLKLSKVVQLDNDSKLTFKLALAKTSAGDSDLLGQDDGLDSAQPTVEALIAFDAPIFTSKPAKFSIGGQFGKETLDQPGANDSRDFDSHLLVAGLHIPFAEQFALQANLWTGENLDGFLGGVGQGINTTLDTSVAAKGGWVQAVFYPTDRWNLNLGYGIDDPKDEDLNPGGRSKNSRLFVSAFYQLTEAVTLAAEYSHITTGYKDASDASDNRIQLSTKYQF
ncbi:MAG: carbohydrate porin [Opitutales bacterium]|nr:carbohydrate porin [Opitutales bacterium]